MTRTVILLIFLGVLPPFSGNGAFRLAVENGTSPEDRRILEEKIEIARKSGKLPQQALAVAQSFIGTPYVHGTLGDSGDESLTVNLRELDCWTFVESSLAIARTASAPGDMEDIFESELRQLRYWGGTIDGYASRIHYFSGWLLQAEKRGLLTDITRQIGGIPFDKDISFMSLHPELYGPLRDAATLQRIQNVEARLNRHSWYFIPQNKIADVEDQIHDGDIIAITSGKKGLDIAHEGFAVRFNGHIHLLHASSLAHKVILSGRPLADYVIEQKGQTGIIVARLNP